MRRRHRGESGPRAGPGAWAGSLGLLLGLHVAAPGAAAQELDAEHTRITTRADVSLAVENGPGTSREELGPFGAVLGRQLGAIRVCYSRVSRQRPHVRGVLRLRAVLEPGGGRVELTRDEVGDEELRRCTVDALAAAPFEELRPPGSAYLTLTFTNTAAEGAERIRARGPSATAAVTRSADGHLETEGGTPGGEVRFRVVAPADADEARLRLLHGALRTHIALLLDCRRKAGRRASPAGDITLDLNVARTGRAQARTRESTVADDRGKRCLE